MLGGGGAAERLLTSGGAVVRGAGCGSRRQHKTAPGVGGGRVDCKLVSNDGAAAAAVAAAATSAGGRAGVETLGLRRDPAADTTTSEVSRDPH